MTARALCDLCLHQDDSLERTLYDMAHIEQRDLKTLASLGRHQADGFFEQVRNIARKRKQAQREASLHDSESLSRLRDGLFDGLLDELASSGGMQRLIDGYLNDSSRHALEERVAHDDMAREFVEEKDVMEALDTFIRARLIDVHEGTYRFTPRGCRRLAAHILRRIMENVRPGMSGTNNTNDEGFGTSEGFVTRAYEFGDEFSRIDAQATLLAAMERGAVGAPVRFEEKDIRVRETVMDSRVVNGLIIDASGSMAGDKLHAAMDISLALSELIGQRGRGSLRIYVFSNTVQEVSYWEIPNRRFSGNITDMRGALKRFRTQTQSIRCDKQVYLITDTAPNSENGKYIGFERAMPGVLEEARYCRLNGITLNIVMLDGTQHLNDLASALAKRNTGRVFFAKPGDLGRVVVEDYLKRNRRRGHG